MFIEILIINIMFDGIDISGDMKKALNESFKMFSCKIKLHKNFNCSNATFEEIKAMPNKPKGSNQDVFQFLDNIKIEKGDVIEKIVSNEYYIVEKTEPHTLGDVFLYLWAYVKKIDSQGNFLN